ncbi:MAG: HD-GYP domain-containing protein [Anaerolineae bacterium]
MLWAVRAFTWSNQSATVVLLLPLLFCALELFPIKVRPGESNVTLGESVGIAAVILLPPYIIPLVTLAGKGMSQTRVPLAWYKKTSNVAKDIVVYTTLSWTFQHIAGHDPLVLASMPGVAVIALLTLEYQIFNYGLLVPGISLISRVPISSIWRSNFRDLIPQLIFTAPLGMLLALLMQQHPLTAILLLPPVYMMHRALELTVELRRQTTNALMAFADSVDKRDPATFQHSQRVAHMARAVAEQMGLPPDEAETIYLSARLHDLGKVGISDAVLLKPGRLTDDEYEVIKQHPVISADIVESFPTFRIGHDMIRHHHERYDGTGYPDRVAGEDIPIGARIIAVVDSYDAMTSDRPYRAGMPREKALRIILEERGKQLDARVVDAFLEVMGVTSLVPTPKTNGRSSPAVRVSSGEKVSVTICSS